ncbi:hypothetical protein EVAR_34665_1 [Eumeta japonica]|uniref:Uncharacterized protein n=1 Tax=Eumeta variegata TaxID=151549 RepID=A0A4C1VET3_EUMVA|nr:hypothetical protein EVAR_34665_1 [Eumeta japonica]
MMVVDLTVVKETAFGARSGPRRGTYGSSSYVCHVTHGCTCYNRHIAGRGDALNSEVGRLQTVFLPNTELDRHEFVLAREKGVIAAPAHNREQFIH